MSDMRQMTELGRRIESDSFSIIDAEVGPHSFPPREWEIVRRVIHATADFEYKDLMHFHPRAVDAGIEALRRSCPILPDVKMIQVGLNEERLQYFACPTACYISDADVIQVAKDRNSTRAREAYRKAHREKMLDGAIVAVGNAPTALLEILDLARDEGVRPALVVGVPVGFVSAAESKEALMESDIPFIVSRGRKGGSTIAVSILHALMVFAAEKHA
jgi:precorrin-8X/cobalt-precorrin-8 methylmutase